MDCPRTPHVVAEGVRVVVSDSAKWGRPVVLLSHEIKKNDPDLAETLRKNVGLAIKQAVFRYPQDVLDLQLSGLDDATWLLDWVLDAQPSNVKRVIDSYRFRLAPAELCVFKIAQPFVEQANVRLYRTVLPKVTALVKAHDFVVTTSSAFQAASECLGAALAQVHARHRHVCELLQVSFSYVNDTLTIYYLMESLETDLDRVIPQRSDLNLVLFLEQMTDALKHAHGKQIAHRDIRPQNIYCDNNGYSVKLGAFGGTMASSAKGKLQYMSPQQRALIAGEIDHYDPFKDDVFSLGLVAISLAAKQLFAVPIPNDLLAESLNRIVQGLGIPDALKTLLLGMTAVSEGDRLSITEVDRQVTAFSEEVLRLQAFRSRAREPASSQLPDQQARAVHTREPSSIPVLKGDSLILFHPLTLQHTRTTLSTPTHISSSTACCFIRDNVLLCCGGMSGFALHKEVWEVHVGEGTAQRTDYMNEVRAFTGLWQYQDRVYAFGGWNGRSRLKSSEKYAGAKPWTTLDTPLQAAKDCCSVCELNDFLFISGCDVDAGSSTIERFCPQAEVFTLLRADTSLYPYASILCSDGSNLFCVHHDRVERGNAGGSFAGVANFKQVGSGSYWLNYPLQWNGGLTSVLWVGDSGGVVGLFHFSPAGQFAQVLAFDYDKI